MNRSARPSTSMLDALEPLSESLGAGSSRLCLALWIASARFGSLGGKLMALTNQLSHGPRQTASESSPTLPTISPAS